MTQPKPPEQKSGAEPLPTPKVGGSYKATPGEAPKRVIGASNPTPSPATSGQPATPPGDE